MSIIKSIVIAAMAAGALTATAESKINLPTKSHDFGNINEKAGSVSYDFTFTNDGDTPLVILDARAECGCTRPDIPKEPVQPGKTAKIKVTYLPDGRPGEFVKTVKVTTNDPTSKRVKLKISGVVVPAK